MIREMIYIVEILSVLKCAHCIYGEKIRINKSFFVTVILLFLIMDFANRYDIAIEGTILMYSVFGIYCIAVFDKSAKVHIINTAFYMIAIVMIQLFCGGIIALLFNGSMLMRTLISDALVLLFCYILLPMFKLHKIAEWALQKNIVLYLSLGYIFLIIMQLLIQLKVVGSFRIGTYLTLVPFIIYMFFLCKQGREYQHSYMQKDMELQLYVDDKEKFRDYVSGVRSRQHEMNNHIMAILAMHYTAGTYEELVREQNQYCERLAIDNKYNSLLALYNSVLPGFLYDKLTHIESKGIVVECTVAVEKYEAYVPDYYMIELLGILLDNATEAVLEYDKNKRIYIGIIQTDMGYDFIVRNPYRYVPYDEIEGWFGYEKSSKGKGRGIGLYHLRSICREWDCLLGCNNVEYQETNWIEFKIETRRKGK